MTDENIRVIADIHELIDALNLAQVDFYSVSGTRSDEMIGRFAPEGAEVSSATFVRRLENGIDYRCRLEVKGEGFEISVDGAILYRSDGLIDVSDEITRDFGTRVAAMSLFPYLRQNVTDIGARIGVDITLPMVQPGMIDFSGVVFEGGEEPEAADDSSDETS